MLLRDGTAYVFERAHGRWHVVVPIAGKFSPQILEAAHATRVVAQQWLDSDEGRACVARIRDAFKLKRAPSARLPRSHAHQRSLTSSGTAAVCATKTLSADAPATLLQALDKNAVVFADKVAVRIVGAGGEEEASVTFAGLRALVEEKAEDMLARGLRGERVVFARQTSIAALVELLGAMRAGVTAVPVDPRSLLRTTSPLEAVLRICAPAVLATDARETAAVKASASAVVMLEDLPRDSTHSMTPPVPTDLALLQFTSGSTSDPKGVMITHANLMANVEALNVSFRAGSDDVVVSWLPLFHDMGLMLGAVWPIVSGASVVLMRPASFIADPLLWLRTISRYRATVSSGPNFGYQLCLDRIADEELDGLDLSSWRIAICGAEPVRHGTVRSFQRRFARCGLRPQALAPCYGLAEATVFVSGHVQDRTCSIVDFDERALAGGQALAMGQHGDAGAVRSLVSCGRIAANLSVRLVGDGDRPVPDGELGEIVVAGPSVSHGYYRASEASSAAFNLPIPGEAGGFLKTGDLGFLHAGELFVVGRIKDLIIVRGVNHHPADMEATCRAAAPELSTCECAAFAAADADAATLVVELPRRSALDAGRLAAAVRRDVAANHGLVLGTIAFVPPRRLPRTTSGKLRRRETAELWARGRLATFASFEADRDRVAAPRLGPRAASATEEAVRAAWAEVLGIADVPRDANFFELGGDSIRVAAVHAKLAAGCAGRLAVSDLFAHPTVRALASHIDEGEGASSLDEARRRGRRRGQRHLDRRIAIVGMAGRFPGAPDLDAYWNLLIERRQAGVTNAGTTGSTRLDGADLFDATFFDVSAVEARLMDPQQRILLECVYAALEAAGCVPGSTTGAIGTFVGCGMNPGRLPLLAARLGRQDAAERWGTILGNDKDYLAARIAYKLRLTGPSLTIQTACSTSLVAVHVACQSLLAGECDTALAGGVSVGGADVPEGSRRGGDVFSSADRCRPFDAAADGTVFGEGCGVVVMKRFSDAVAAGDHVHAVVLGSATNNDGAARLGFSAPGVRGQSAVVAEALAAAGVHAEDVGYVEAHGTGTPLGDPLEVAALARAFRTDTQRRGYCALGSVKANIGHLTAAAGVAGLIKTVLSLEHEVLPPQACFNAPSAALDLPATPFKVCTVPTSWPRSGVPRVAGVSSFGMGGTNAHVVVGEAPPPSAPREARAELLLVSAKTAEALDRAASSLAFRLEARPEIALADVAHSLSHGRPEYAHRRTVVASSVSEAAQALAGGIGRRRPGPAVEAATPVVFAMPGAGSQRAMMGSAVWRREEAYRKTFNLCCAALSDELGFDLRAAVLDDGADAGRLMSRVEVAQPALFAVSVALAALWRSWGVEPAALLGHSFGEVTAACVAGVFELEDAARFVALRSRLVAGTPAGAMLAVLARKEDFECALAPGLSIACLNGEAAHVVSGPRPLIEALDARLSREGTLCRPIATDQAFHSALMDDAVGPLVEHLAGVRMRPPRLPLISGVSGDWIGAEAASPGYWGRHLREPVRFADGLRTLVACDARVLLEVGPGRVLCRLAQQAFPDGRLVGIAGLPDADGGEREVSGLLRAAGDLWARGCARSSRDVAPGFGSKVPLPMHPMLRRRYVLAHDVPPWPLDDAVPVDPPAAAGAELGNDAPTYLATVYVPGGGPGAAVSAAWCEVLEMPHVAVDDDFFDLGGHSLLAARLADRLATTFGTSVSAADVMRHPTPERMIQHLVSASPGRPRRSPLTPEPVE